MRDLPDPNPPERRRPGPVASIRSSFLTGLVVVLPLGLTAWLVWTLAGWVDGVVLPLVPRRFQPEQYIGINLHGIGIIFFLLFTLTIGWTAKGLIGKSLLRWSENIVDRMPIVRSIYGGIKQIAETIFAQQDTSFDMACLLEYPRKGVWAIGFVSTTAKGEIARAVEGGEDMLSIFLPTTPNPTSGFLLFVPREDVTILDMSVEDAAKLVISAGLVYPGPKEPDAAEPKPLPEPLPEPQRA